MLVDTFMYFRFKDWLTHLEIFVELLLLQKESTQFSVGRKLMKPLHMGWKKKSTKKKYMIKILECFLPMVLMDKNNIRMDGICHL